MSGFYYAVAKGRRPGIYETWDECKEQVYKFSGPVYKKFPTLKEAQAFVGCIHQSLLLPTGDLFRIGGREVKNNSKRVRSSSESNEKETVVSTKRKKTVTSIFVPACSSSSSNNSVRSEKIEKKHFDMDPDGFVNVYTDGACSSNGHQGAKAGVGVYFGEDSPLNVSEPVVGRATNNMAEIQAVTRAAERAREAGMSKIRVHTDSEFLIKSATQWMQGWKARGWTTAANKPVVNRQELQEMESALKPLTVEWNHVRGHRGIHGNEMADKLAREGAERYRKY